LLTVSQLLCLYLAACICFGIIYGMELSRNFTKVRTKPRKPLAFRPFLKALDTLVLSDAKAVVRFALARDKDNADEAAVSASQQKEHTS
jgi:hypothetical protein